jgi:regulatory protein
MYNLDFNFFLMPKTITQIIVQQKKKNRCSIFLDDEFGFGLHQEVVFHFGLKKGDKLTEAQIEEILYSEEKKKATERALNFLSHRDRSEKEMRTKLKQVGFEEKIINLVIDDLKRLQLIDDKKFSMSFAKNTLFTRPVGEFLLKNELKQKGLSDDLIAETVDSLYKAKSQFDIAFELARKRKKLVSHLDEIKAKKRVSDFLARRGFSWDIVLQIIEHWEDLDIEDE